MMNYEGFAESEIFPKPENHKGDVYVLLFTDGRMPREFYVGQTQRFHGRMDDYFWAHWAAATDFKVGMAISYFCKQPGGRVIVRHKAVDDPRADEAKILAVLKGKGLPLLNDPGMWYDYRSANLKDIRDLVYKKCEEIIAGMH